MTSQYFDDVTHLITCSMAGPQAGNPPFTAAVESSQRWNARMLVLQPVLFRTKPRLPVVQPVVFTTKPRFPVLQPVVFTTKPRFPVLPLKLEDQGPCFWMSLILSPHIKEPEHRRPKNKSPCYRKRKLPGAILVLAAVPGGPVANLRGKINNCQIWTQ